MSAELLIEDLTREAKPVRRLRPPMTRALIWLGVTAVAALVLILTLANLKVFAARAADPRLAWEIAATLGTGVAGVIAAFHLSVPDRSRAWALLPAPFAALWLGLTGWGCYRDWGEQTVEGWRLGHSGACFIFLVMCGAPLGLFLILALRRARPLQPRLTASLGAVGVAGLAAFLLQFFHPFDITLLDLGVHGAALALLIAVMAMLPRRLSGGV